MWEALFQALGLSLGNTDIFISLGMFGVMFMLSMFLRSLHGYEDGVFHPVVRTRLARGEAALSLSCIGRERRRELDTSLRQWTRRIPSVSSEGIGRGTEERKRYHSIVCVFLPGLCGWQVTVLQTKWMEGVHALDKDLFSWKKLHLSQEKTAMNSGITTRRFDPQRDSDDEDENQKSRSPLPSKGRNTTTASGLGSFFGTSSKPMESAGGVSQRELQESLVSLETRLTIVETAIQRVSREGTEHCTSLTVLFVQEIQLQLQQGQLLDRLRHKLEGWMRICCLYLSVVSDP